ncbi:MAG: GNAT family N-acetyltransferase [Chloroflexota bacterium]|nr:GNAT family N-acetyltransferase [Chloroflexota bacterium]MDE2909847.1 GNAT family N-acetyltransferase [Chloroflexota bacterium]
MLGDRSKAINIAKAGAADLVDLSDFIKPFVDSGEILPRTYDELEYLLDTFFIARLGGRIVGCAALEIYSRKLCEIRSLAVDPEAQGLGIGKGLVAACVELAAREGVYEIMAISSAEEFFKSCGFDFTLPNLKRAFFLQTRDEM